MSAEKLVRQLEATKAGGFPDGTHLVTLREVAVVKRKKGGHWLRLVSESDGGSYAREQRRLSNDDQYPFNLTAGQRKGIVEFAGRFGITESDPELIVKALEGMLGQTLNVTVTHTPHATIFQHSQPTGVRISTDAGTMTVHGEIEERAASAHESYEKLIDGLSASRLAMAVVAEACYELSRDHAYRDLGYEKLADLLADPAICLSRTTFFDLAAIYERYVKIGGAAPTELQVAGVSKLSIPLPALAAGEVDVEEALRDCEELGRRDLRAKYRGEEDDEKESGRPDCPRCHGIPDQVLDELRRRYEALGA